MYFLFLFAVRVELTLKAFKITNFSVYSLASGTQIYKNNAQKIYLYL